MTKEAAQAMSWLAANRPGVVSTTLDTPDLKSLLLETDGNIICGGHVCEIRAKHIGAGVHKVTLFCKWEAG
jgi:hypothetical protein